MSPRSAVVKCVLRIDPTKTFTHRWFWPRPDALAISILIERHAELSLLVPLFHVLNDPFAFLAHIESGLLLEDV